MSTPLGHIAAGMAIYFCYGRLRSPHTRWALPCLVLLAVLPDADYLTIWLFGIRQEPRVTHGILFCVIAGIAAWWLTRRLQENVIGVRPLGVAGFILAPLSHLALDFSVGAHTLPIFWPLPNGDLMSPLPLLPGVVHARSIANLALWRNSILESLVLIPVLLLMVARARAVPFARIARTARFVLPVWCMSLCWTVSLAV